MSPFMGGGFGSGLRPQFQVVLAVLAARALQRSVRVVLTRPQMYALGYRPAMIQRIALGANAGGTLDVITHDAVTVTSQYEDFHRQETGWSGLLYKSAQCEVRAQARAARSRDLVRHARAQRHHRALCARIRDGRARGRAQARSARASPAVLFGPRSARGQAVQQQGAARMLPPGRGGVRLGQAQPRAALDARRQRSGRLGHGDGRLGSRCRCRSRCASCSPPTAMPRWRARPPTSAPAPTPSWRRSRPTCWACRSTTSASSSATRALPQSPVEGGSWIATSVSNGIATTAGAIRDELLRLAKQMPNSPLANAASDEVALADGKLVSKRDASRARDQSPMPCGTAPWTASSRRKPPTPADDHARAHNTHAADLCRGEGGRAARRRSASRAPSARLRPGAS